MIETEAGNRQILRRTGDNVILKLFVEEVATNADGAVTVSITKDDGTVIAQDLPATKPAATTGEYRFALSPAQTGDLDLLTAVWKCTVGGLAQELVTDHEVIGGFYASMREMRSQKDLEDVAKHPTESLIAARIWCQAVFERFCGKAFVPRYASEILDAEGTDYFDLTSLPLRSLRQARVSGNLVAAEDLAKWIPDATGRVVREGSPFVKARQSLWVAYEYGLDAPPEDLKRAALIYIRWLMLEEYTDITERATGYTSEGGGTFDIAVPDEEHPTGLPAVDAVLLAYREPHFTVA